MEAQETSVCICSGHCIMVNAWYTDDLRHPPAPSTTFVWNWVIWHPPETLALDTMEVHGMTERKPSVLQSEDNSFNQVMYPWQEAKLPHRKGKPKMKPGSPV